MAGNIDSTDTTQLATMVNPEVMGDMISAELPKVIRFTSIAPIDATLQGQPGDAITVPRFKYIGDATDFTEGQMIDYAQLTTDTDQFTIKKAGKGVKITDEAMLSGYGNPVQEGEHQVVLSVASKIDNDTIATAMKAPLALSTNVDVVDMVDAIEAAFNDNTDERSVEDSAPATGVLFMNPKDVNKLRKAAGLDWTRATALGDSILVNGTFGELLGWQIIRTMKMSEGAALAIKPGAMRTYMKRNVLTESGRDMDHKLTKFNADVHYGVAIYDDTKLLAINPDKFTGTGTVIEANTKRGKKTADTASGTTSASTPSK
ncbi:N4-gp56 family major capsid protein [Companilactobacillus allii]|uniref:N4-gp56 family major capsid protein n=1 Tax=Companilactobacillus allii TaxID=1847728 RepID=A0A1P8Q4U0_9LACO|nr:N4-gp56 family major capsid protein [Companilactobacillus allii]APX72868.1 N4-gp56 family major capsid protein [Companilactobacillus allii]USQ67656.1 N4-gp56 family major capsid protein [Companilactobacillus allii]